MEILADVGGKPGLDCKGFCSYCYFRGVKDIKPFGCKYCMPFQKGCDYCSRAIVEGYPGFNQWIRSYSRWHRNASARFPIKSQ